MNPAICFSDQSNVVRVQSPSFAATLIYDIRLRAGGLVSPGSETTSFRCLCSSSSLDCCSGWLAANLRVKRRINEKHIKTGPRAS